MALTKPRAYQIYDIDYKQAVRVVSISNVTLAGGAPNSVDGVNLSLNDRILVTGQTSGVQNGIYYVTTLGTGANGTWTRSTDTDATGELLSGTIVMVTEGTTYADTQWKLTTNDPITIGSTALTFVQNYLANSISYGSTAFAIGSSNANATISVAGTSNVAVYATTGEYITGLISATGNVTGGNITTAGQVSATANITGGNILTSGIVSATGNVQGGNLVLVNGNLTLGNVNAFTSNSAIQGWSYPTISLSISASEGTSTGLFFGNSGSSFYVVGTTNDRVYQYNMSTVNMANTGTVFGNVSVTTQDGTPGDLFIDSSGANLYMIGGTSRVVYQYTMSSPWNITTASYSTLSANISAQETAPTGLWFKPDLTTMYVVGTTNNTVYQYTLATPGNIATATYASKSVSVSTAASAQAVNLSSDGTKMWVLSSTTTSVYEYNLGTAWDVSTATHVLGNSYSVRPQESTPTGLYVDIANARAWVVGQSSDTVFQYNTANSIIAQANAVGIQGQLQVQGNAYFGQFTNFQSSVAMENTLTVDSTLTGASGITFSTTTSAINIGTSQTTGTTIIGGTAQTGNLLIGRSTATQGIVIGNGVTASGSTKTIDIGTLGAANSTTNINIGPTAGNATVSFLSNALVSIANTSGAALSVVGNITGGNVNTAGAISVTGNITSAANIAGGNLIATANVVTVGVSASGNITGGNLLTGGLISSTGNITSAANIVGGNILATTVVSGASLLGSLASISGNVTGGNIITSGLVSTPVVTGTTVTISATGGAITLSPSGNISASSKNINNVADPLQNQDAATKAYVDNVATTGITYHTAVTAATTANLATTTGGTIAYAQPNGAGNGVGATLTVTGSTFNLIDTANVQTANTRILVKDEANAVTNGVYVWSNATVLTRSTDTDEYGADSANSFSINDYFFVSSGNVNKGSAYVVSSPAGTITFGTSNIQFSQFSSSQTYTANTSAGISLAGTVINAKVDNTTTAFDGSGNISVKTSAQLTTPNIGDATGTSLSVTGNLTSAGASVSGNITGGNLLTPGIVSAVSHIGSVVSVTGNVTGGNLLTGGVISAASNITGGNILTGGLISATSTITSAANITGGNILTSGIVSATGNITGNYILGNGSQLTGLPALYGNSNVAAYLASGTDTSNVITTANVSGGNLLTSGLVSATGNVTSAGNISGTYLLGNVFYATGISASKIYNGTSEANIGTSSGNANITIGGTSNVVVFASTGEYVTGLISASGNITSAGNISGGNILGNGQNLTGINAFSTIAVSGQSDVLADSIADTLTFIAGTGISITTDAANDSISISSVSTTSIFATGGDMGLVTEAVTTSEDLGLVTDAVTVSYDLGSVVSASGLVYPSQLILPTYTVATLPGAAPAAQFVYLSTSSIGAMTAFSDGTNWRFTSSGNIVS